MPEERHSLSRRTALRVGVSVVAVGLAGCTRLSGSKELESAPTGNSSTTTSTPSTTTDAVDVQRRVAIVDQDTVADEYDLRLDAEVVEPTITDAYTARLRVTMTNEGEKRGFARHAGDCGPFKEGEGGSDEPLGLWLHRPESATYIDREGDKWVADRPPDQLRGAEGDECGIVAYDTGESQQWTYEVWDDYQVSGYLEPDTYRWESWFGIWADPTANTSDEPSAEFTWGFSLAVETPD